MAIVFGSMVVAGFKSTIFAISDVDVPQMFPLLFGPKIFSNVLESGGGIGYIPIDISISDKPSDQMSD